MVSILYILIAGIVLMFLILQFDIQQRRRINKILKETKTVQPLFLLRAAEQKLRSLNTILYGNMPTSSSELAAGRINMNEGARQMIASQLANLVHEHHTGKISLKVYNNELGEMLKMVTEIKGMNFEQI